MLSSGGQGDGKQGRISSQFLSNVGQVNVKVDRILAEFVIVKRAVAQDCCTICPSHTLALVKRAEHLFRVIQ